jgi:GxxExxY protein
VEILVFYRGRNIRIGFRADIVVNDFLLLKLKAVETFHQEHPAQVINHLKRLQFKRGLLISFNKKMLREGVR